MSETKAEYIVVGSGVQDKVVAEFLENIKKGNLNTAFTGKQGTGATSFLNPKKESKP